MMLTLETRSHSGARIDDHGASHTLTSPARVQETGCGTTDRSFLHDSCLAVQEFHQLTIQQRQEVVKDVALRLVRDNVRRQAGVHERYFEELAAILAKPGSPDVQAIAALRKRYDTEQVSALST
jgi:hypothetical protein